MPSVRAAAVVQSMKLSDDDGARRNRERLAQAKPDLRSQNGKRRSKVSLALVPPSLCLHKGDEDATDQRLMQAHVVGEVIGKLGPARYFSDPFATLAKRQSLNPGDTKAAIDLNEALFLAGVKYRKDYEGAKLGPLRSKYVRDATARTTASSLSHGEFAVTCRKRVDEVREIIGPRMIGLVDAVVIEGKTLTEMAHIYGVSKDFRLGQIEVRVMLVEALHQLVRRWRMFDHKALGEDA